MDIYVKKKFKFSYIFYFFHYINNTISLGLLRDHNSEVFRYILEKKFKLKYLKLHELSKLFSLGSNGPHVSSM